MLPEFSWKTEFTHRFTKLLVGSGEFWMARTPCCSRVVNLGEGWWSVSVIVSISSGSRRRECFMLFQQFGVSRSSPMFGGSDRSSSSDSSSKNLLGTLGFNWANKVHPTKFPLMKVIAQASQRENFRFLWNVVMLSFFSYLFDRGPTQGCWYFCLWLYMPLQRDLVRLPAHLKEHGGDTGRWAIT